MKPIENITKDGWTTIECYEPIIPRWKRFKKWIKKNDDAIGAILFLIMLFLGGIGVGFAVHHSFFK